MPHLWFYHPESGSYFLEDEAVFYGQVNLNPDAQLCYEIGPAHTGRVEELRQLLKARGLRDNQIIVETAGMADYNLTKRSNTMAEYELMVPEAAAVPAYIRNPELARSANEEAAAGISTGFPARVKLSGKQFTLVNGNGEETPFPPAKLVAGPDGNVYLPVIVLRAKKSLVKTWYMHAFNPNAEAQAPDCFSNDSERPDASALAPQSELCANCPMNAYGSGTDQAGNATKGKACSDTKILAVFVPGFGVHSFKIPPASLKNFGLYVKQLSAAGIPLGTVKTLVGFDLTATFPVLVFQFGGFLPEDAMGKLSEMSVSPEVEEIVGGVVVAPASKQVAAPVQTPPPAPPEAKQDDDPLGLNTAPPPPVQKRTRTPKQTPAPVQQQTTPADDLGLGGGVSAGAGSVTDDQLRAELGL